METNHEHKKFQIMSINPWFIVGVVLLLPTPAYSQTFLVGAKVAARPTNSFGYPAPTNDNEDEVLFGLMAGVRVAPGFMVEVNGLYKRNAGYTNLYTHVNATVLLNITTDVSAHSWEIPLLLKYRIPHHNRLFVGGGFAARNIVGTTQTVTSTDLYPLGLPPVITKTSSSNGDILHHWTYGPVVALGADFQTHKVHFQPELRFTHWNTPTFPYDMKLGSVEALLGIAVGK
jgi:Outer membrane protein beta-barrel domain